LMTCGRGGGRHRPRGSDCRVRIYCERRSACSTAQPSQTNRPPAYFSFSIVNLPNETPTFTPVPLAVRVSEMSPLVTTDASVDLPAPAWASPCPYDPYSSEIHLRPPERQPAAFGAHLHPRALPVLARDPPRPARRLVERRPPAERKRHPAHRPRLRRNHQPHHHCHCAQHSFHDSPLEGSPPTNRFRGRRRRIRTVKMQQ
jgi:hypothetical protein